MTRKLPTEIVGYVEVSAKHFTFRSRQAGQVPLAVVDLFEFLLSSADHARTTALHELRIHVNARRNPARRRAYGRA